MADTIIFMERVESVLKEKKLTQKELAEKLNLRRPTLSEWKKNGAVPAGDICLKIADYLGVSVEWLISGREGKITEEELKLLKAYCKLDTVQKDTLWTLINKWLADYAAAEKKENPA